MEAACGLLSTEIKFFCPEVIIIYYDMCSQRNAIIQGSHTHF